MSLHAGDAIRFDFDAAARLSSLLRSTAQELTDQTGWRRSWADRALQEWRGLFANRFGVRMSLCYQGAEALAQSLRTAAEQLDRMAEQARDEQRRRDAARAWFEQQNSMNFLERAWDSFDDWLTGPDVPPSFEAGTPPRVTVSLPVHIPGSRD
jgi:uncharacterized protein YukE